ncbi:hypothetical protein MsAg5_16460 [Methanosarcinaceae archaeon Ag5]|uniref:Uncharacterized protein n=1 Tax=Methanolapillus africanus TaxID=3028297 RepID=A0AAE4MK91_9EURY|nr:hypothetical protein [Methanosarcinaceae archaeon Ag5]
MKIKIILIAFLIFFSVFTAGCLNQTDINDTIPETNDSIPEANNSSEQNGIHYNSNYQVTDFEYGRYENVPKGENSKYLTTEANISYMYSSPENLENADLIVYATVKEIKPSFWVTKGGAKPSELTYRYDSYHQGPTARSDDIEICTDIVFTVDDWVKGNSSDEITVRVVGGEANNVIQYREMWPSPWDFEEGDQCLLYLTYYSDAYEFRAPNGVKTVVN